MDAPSQAERPAVNHGGRPACLLGDADQRASNKTIAFNVYPCRWGRHSTGHPGSHTMARRGPRAVQ
jgi:hypothetical protein